MNQVQVGGKTGTAQVADKSVPNGISDTSVFASFAGKPGQDPQYVSIIMVPKGGYGAAVAGPATRKLWDGIYGLEGHPNVMPQGPRVPLPNFSNDGNIVTKGPAIAPGVPVAPSGSADPRARPPPEPPPRPPSRWRLRPAGRHPPRSGRWRPPRGSRRRPGWSPSVPADARRPVPQHVW